jgi:Ankyrin repeats (3 copies)
VRLLVASAGTAATVNALQNHTLCTPLLLALGPRRSPELVKFLADSGADVNASNSKGETPLMLAMELPLLKLLLEAGAAVNATSADGSTALHYAAKQGVNAAVICCLLKAGADATATDSKGLDAAAVAAERGHAAVAALLQRAADDQRSKQQQQWQQERYLISVSAVLESATLLPRSASDFVVGRWQCADNDHTVRCKCMAAVVPFMYNNMKGYEGDLLARAKAAVEQARVLEAAVYSCAVSLEAYSNSEAWQRKVLQAQRWLTIQHWCCSSSKAGAPVS